MRYIVLDISASSMETLNSLLRNSGVSTDGARFMADAVGKISSAMFIPPLDDDVLSSGTIEVTKDVSFVPVPVEVVATVAVTTPSSGTTDTSSI